MRSHAGDIRGDRRAAVDWRVAVVAAGGVVAALLAGHLAGMAIGIGPLSSHMAQHVVVMNVMAPILALALIHVMHNSSQSAWSRPVSEGALLWAVIAQIAVLWAWHIPLVFDAARSSALLLAAMHLSLLAVALLFWISIFSVHGNSRWKPIAALVVTGKLFCLLGALLIFAPQPLYGLTEGVTMSDQQLAGLLMIAACPLTYIVAGIVIAARWMADLDREDRRPPAAAPAARPDFGHSQAA